MRARLDPGPSNTSARRSMPSSSRNPSAQASKCSANTARTHTARGPFRRVARPARGRGRPTRESDCGVADRFAFEDVVVLGPLAAPEPPARWSADHGGQPDLLGASARERERDVGQLSCVRAGQLGRQVGRATRCSPSSVRADSSSTCGPGPSLSFAVPAVPPRRRHERWYRRRRTS